MKSFLAGVLLMSSINAMAENISVKVNGMVCSMCAQGIQKKFKAVSEVELLNVDLDTKIVSIQTKKGSTVSDAVITNIIKEAGYNVERIERK